MFRDFGTKEQKEASSRASSTARTRRLRPDRAESRLRRNLDGNARPCARATDGSSTAQKTWNTGLHVATHDFVFARTIGHDGGAKGITCFIVPVKSPGFKIEEYLWTFNMPTDHRARSRSTNVCVPGDAMLGDGRRGLEVAQHFVHENRIRQAASSRSAPRSTAST